MRNSRTHLASAGRILHTTSPNYTVVAKNTRDRLKFGFGYGAECRPKCGFGLDSASAEVVTANFGLHSASAVYECLRPNVYEDTFVNQQLLTLDSRYLARTVKLSC